MKKPLRKKTYKEDFTKNHDYDIRYRKRLQEDKEKLQELKEFDADPEIQDPIRRDDFPQQVRTRPE
jgi:hypothetical protein